MGIGTLALVLASNYHAFSLSRLIDSRRKSLNFRSLSRLVCMNLRKRPALTPVEVESKQRRLYSQAIISIGEDKWLSTNLDVLKLCINCFFFILQVFIFASKRYCSAFVKLANSLSLHFVKTGNFSKIRRNASRVSLTLQATGHQADRVK